jgi:hypothetical protein
LFSRMDSEYILSNLVMHKKVTNYTITLSKSVSPARYVKVINSTIIPIEAYIIPRKNGGKTLEILILSIPSSSSYLVFENLNGWLTTYFAN